MSTQAEQRQLASFIQELFLMEKTAAPPAATVAESVARVARTLGSRPRYLAGLLGGAGAGTLAGAAVEPTGSEEQRLRDILWGAGLGALGGAGLAKGVQWLGQAPKGVTGAERLARILGAQYYGLTGKLPGAVPSSTVAKRMKELGVGEPAAAEELAKGKAKDLPRLRARLEAAREGLENIPGVLRSLVRGPGRTLERVWRAQTPLGKTVMLGAAALPAHEIATTRPGTYGPGKEYKSRAQHVAREFGTTLGYTAGGLVPIVPVLALGAGLGEAGKAVGSLA